MIFETGKKYHFMGQRYAYSGTVVLVTPTHVKLGEDAQVHYEDVGTFDNWSRSSIAYKAGSPVPGQVVCVLGCDATPMGVLVNAKPIG